MSPKTEQDSIYYNNTQANKTSRGVIFCQDMLFFGINLDPGVFHLVRHISFSVGTPWRCWTRKPWMNRSKLNYLTRHVCWSLVACSPTLPESNSSALPKQTSFTQIQRFHVENCWSPPPHSFSHLTESDTWQWRAELLRIHGFPHTLCDWLSDSNDSIIWFSLVSDLYISQSI